MAINTFLITDLNATHFWSLDNNLSEEIGVSTPTPSPLALGVDATFILEPICEKYTYSVKTASGTDFTTLVDGASITNQNDINLIVSTTYGLDQRSIILWSKSEDTRIPTCMYEQGGSVNNFAFTVGIGKSITFQCADSGQEFLIVQSKLQALANRPYFLYGYWGYRKYNGNANNGAEFYINGVLQESYFGTGTEPFPAHSGDIVIGNTADSLQTYNAGTMKFPKRGKWTNMLGFYNYIKLTELQAREIFERTTLAEITIEAGTVSTQQATLDGLLGTSYVDKNCAIRIVQATDAVDYTLRLDNITFKRVDELRDIHIQYLGANVLTIDNCNGSNAYELSTPIEVERSADILIGGGSIVNILNSSIIKTTTDVVGLNAQNIYFDIPTNAVINVIDSSSALKVYNISQNTLTINATNSSLTIDNLGTGVGQIDLQNIVTVRIKVVDIFGNNLQDARVLLTDGVSDLINTLTDVNGEVSIQFNYSSDITVSGRVRKATTPIYYKTSTFSGTISSGGLDTTVIMLKDE